MANHRVLTVSAEELRDLYVTQELSQDTIAKRFGVSQVTVGNYLLKYGIETRGFSGYAKTLNRERLFHLYHEKKMAIKAVAAEFGCSSTRVLHNLTRFGMRITNEEDKARKRANIKARYEGAYVHRGYRNLMMPEHPQADKNGYVAEHRFVAEKAIGRLIHPNEDVHHINLRKRDNRIENLTVLRRADHGRVHKYIERVGVYLVGLTDIRPEALDFGAPVFWGGKYITSLDLISDGARRDIAEAVADNDYFNFEQFRAGGIAERIN